MTTSALPAYAQLVAGETEKAFQARVVRVARLLGWRQYHTYDARRSPHGWPDLVLLRVRGGVGRLIVAELKSERGRATKFQMDWIQELATVPGVEAHLWRPSQWDQILEILK